MAKEKILIIEDNPLQAKETRVVLEEAGLHVKIAETGAQGFKVAKTKKTDLILLDVILPDFTGNQICQWLKKDEATRSIPLIMLTAKSSIEDRVEGLQMGADDYLLKPCNPLELLARIRACLRTKTLQDDLQLKNDQLEDLLKEVEKKAITDPLTGLFNRRYFNDALDKELSRSLRYNEPLTCMMLDIDFFKSVNDNYGHQVGDFVLSEIGKILMESVRMIEVASRYGGEEFTLLFPKTTIKDSLKPANRILEGIATHHFDGVAKDRIITVSIGVAGIPDPLIHDRENLVKCADHALYKAKRGGRNRIEVCKGKDIEDQIV